jgi:hypothetical protein
MANYNNTNMEKAEDVFVIKQPHHKEKDRDIYWGYGGIYSEPRSPLNQWNIIMDKLGNNLLLDETEFVKIKK